MRNNPPSKRKVNPIDMRDNRERYPRSCCNNLNSYLNVSSLHGLRYIGTKEISYFERTFFAVAFLSVLFTSGYFISVVWQKWTLSPIIVTMKAESNSISHSPFPAVTICNMNQAKRSIVKQFKRQSINEWLLKSLCLDNSGNNTKLIDSDHNYTGKWEIFERFLYTVSQPCNEMILKCSYSYHIRRCDEIFRTVLTDDGVCCTFNLVHPKFLLHKWDETLTFMDGNEHRKSKFIDWTPERGYGRWSNMKYKVLPRRPLGSGSHMGLSLILNSGSPDYFCSSTNSIGFKILLHNPVETPKMSDFGMSLRVGSETRISITPIVTEASDFVRSIPMGQRQCVFANERNLTYFRTYTRKNCEMECESQIIQKECGCVLYYMPKEYDSNICSQNHQACYGKIKLAIELSSNDTYSCSCLPACFEIYYTPLRSESTLKQSNFMIRDEYLSTLSLDTIRTNISMVHIYYETNTYRSQIRDEFIGVTEFLSNTGGLLGLFMGFSVVSVIEICYFLSLRPYCDHRRNRINSNKKRKIIKPINDRSIDYIKFREGKFGKFGYQPDRIFANHLE